MEGNGNNNDTCSSPDIKDYDGIPNVGTININANERNYQYEINSETEKHTGFLESTVRKTSDQLTLRKEQAKGTRGLIFNGAVTNNNGDNNNNNDNNEEEESSSRMSQSINYRGSGIREPNNDSATTFGNDNKSTYGAASVLFNKPPAKQSNIMSIMVGAFVAVGGFLFGYDTGLINSVTEMPYVTEHMAPDHNAFQAKYMAILVSFLSLGTFVGALMAPIFSDHFGRKTTVIVSTTTIFLIGNSLQVAATGITLLIVGRVISGIGIGNISAIVPSYQAETVNKNLRGAIISTYQWAITWGLLVSSAVAQGTHQIDSPASYRIPIGLQYVWSTILAIGLLFMPESPRYYVFKDKLDKAAKSLSFLRRVPVDDSGLLEELVEIKATFDYEKAQRSSSFLDCFISSEKRPKQFLRMLTGIALQTFQQFSGINFIFYYGINFFDRTGVHNSYVISLITYAVNVVFNIPGLFFVEYFGRRKVLIYGGICMTISNFIIAIVGSSTNSVVADKVMIAFICVFIASFAASWGGVVWVVSAELYPLGVRAKCTAICAASNWLANFICALITPYIVDTGHHTSTIGTKIYFIWGSLNALGLVIVFFTVYETKGLTLEEVDQLYACCPTSFASEKWNKIIREQHAKFSYNGEMNYGEANITNNNDNFNNKNNNCDLDNTVVLPIPQTFENRESTPPDQLNSGTTVVSPCTYDPDIGNSNISGHIDNNRTPICSDLNVTQNFELSSQYNLPLSDDINNVIVVDPQPPVSKGNIVDLGNGLALNAYRHGPPSLSSESFNDDDEINGSLAISNMNHLSPYFDDGQRADMNNAASVITSAPHSSLMSDNACDLTIGSVDLGNGLSLQSRQGTPPPILTDEEDEVDNCYNHSPLNNSISSRNYQDLLNNGDPNSDINQFIEMTNLSYLHNDSANHSN